MHTCTHTHTHTHQLQNGVHAGCALRGVLYHQVELILHQSAHLLWSSISNLMCTPRRGGEGDWSTMWDRTSLGGGEGRGTGPLCGTAPPSGEGRGGALVRCVGPHLPWGRGGEGHWSAVWDRTSLRVADCNKYIPPHPCGLPAKLFSSPSIFLPSLCKWQRAATHYPQI